MWLLDFGSTREYPGGTALSRAGKTRHPADLHPVNSSRRDFLVRCCQGASAAIVPAGLRGFAFPFIYPRDSPIAIPSDGDFHLHPHYRAQRPLDAVLLKTQAGLDDFITEKYHDQIATILAEWSSSLLHSPQEVHAVERVLTPDFLGSSLRPGDSRLVRPGPVLEVHQNKFSSQTNLGRDAFLQELRSAMSVFFKLMTAEFQVTKIESSSVSPSQLPERLQTRIRYDLSLIHI